MSPGIITKSGCCLWTRQVTFFAPEPPFHNLPSRPADGLIDRFARPPLCREYALIVTSNSVRISAHGFRPPPLPRCGGMKSTTTRVHSKFAADNQRLPWRSCHSTDHWLSSSSACHIATSCSWTASASAFPSWGYGFTMNLRGTLSRRG